MSLSSQHQPLSEVAKSFTRLGCFAFGGPAAHIAMMEEEFVHRRGWVSQDHFLDLVGATNLIPGPNSTEMTMHLGYEAAGFRGLFVAGACFITPAVTAVALLSWVYVAYGSLPQIQPFLEGIKPDVLGVIVVALLRLGKKAIRNWRLGFLGLLVTLFALQGVGEIWALLGGGVMGALWLRAVDQGRKNAAASLLTVLFLKPGGGVAAAPATTAVAGNVSLLKLFWFFLKIGSILYGSGYVLVAFLEGGLVEQLHWLTRGQLLDAIALGQLTPGPVLSTSTCVGYLIAGWPGAVVATVGIFLPSFLFVLLLNPLIPRMRESIWLGCFLDAVNASAVALMAAVTLQIGNAVLTQTWVGWLIFLLGVLGTLRFKLHPAALVFGGSLLGWLFLAG